jgi:hypothetical protein
MNGVVIPRPTYIVIDDVGWWSGTNGSEYGEPYRTGIDRTHCVKDYEALDLFARMLGIKPQIALVIGEWDRSNILKDIPHSNWALTEWDNSHNVGEHLDEAMEIINRGNFCVAIHGLCHEYWEEKGVFTRAEFGFERSNDIIKLHLDAYMQILNDNGYKGKINAFVPPAFCHTVGRVSKLLNQYGVKYMSTIFKSMKYKGMADRYVYENGIINCDRVQNPIPWNSIDSTPPTEIKSGFFGLHWPNILHPNPHRNYETVEKWVSYFNRYKNVYGLILAKDEDEGHQQTVYEKDAKLEVTDEGIRITMLGTIKLDKGCYLHSKRRLQAEMVRKVADFFEYYIHPVDGQLIKWS